jgi:hypothetical protein
MMFQMVRGAGLARLPRMVAQMGDSQQRSASLIVRRDLN